MINCLIKDFILDIVLYWCSCVSWIGVNDLVEVVINVIILWFKEIISLLICKYFVWMMFL